MSPGGPMRALVTAAAGSRRKQFGARSSSLAGCTAHAVRGAGTAHRQAGSGPSQGCKLLLHVRRPAVRTNIGVTGLLVGVLQCSQPRTKAWVSARPHAAPDRRRRHVVEVLQCRVGWGWGLCQCCNTPGSAVVRLWAVVVLKLCGADASHDIADVP